MPNAASPDAAPPIVRINPANLLDSTGLGLSQMSLAEPGRFAFLSGQTATPRDGGDIPEGLAAQAEAVAANLAAALAELGAEPSDVVHLRLFVVAATTERFEQAWSPIRTMLAGVQPTMTGIGVQALWTPALQLEVEMIVRLPDRAA